MVDFGVGGKVIAYPYISDADDLWSSERADTASTLTDSTALEVLKSFTGLLEGWPALLAVVLKGREQNMISHIKIIYEGGINYLITSLDSTMLLVWTMSHRLHNVVDGRKDAA